MLLPLFLGAALVLPHPNSTSSATLRMLSDGSFQADLLLEARTVQEEHVLDTDGDGRLDAAELEAARTYLEGYLELHYELGLGTRTERSTPVFTVELESLVVDGEAPAPDPLLADLWLAADVRFAPPTTLPAEADHLWLDVALFLPTSPDHLHFARLLREPESLDRAFSAANPRWIAPLAGAAPRQGIGVHVRLGVDHILGGWDHLLFLAALVLATRSMRALLATVTAFTVAHSITLGLAATGHLPAGGRWVEAIIAASIAWVGLHNIVAKTPRSTWKEAGGFGLIHGLGFAGFLTGVLARSGRADAPLGALLGFNLGVELGQVAVALALAAALALAERMLPKVPPRRFVVVGSLGVAAMGCFWTVERLIG